MSQETALIYLGLDDRRVGMQAVFEYDGSNRILYAGYAKRGILTSAAEWYIEKYTYNASGLVATIQTAPHDSIWDNRASLTYA